MTLHRGPRLRPLCAMLGLLAALGAGSAVRAESEPGPRLRIPARGPIRPGDRIEFTFEGESSGVDEFEILLSTDGGRTYPVRISERLRPGTRRLRWRVPHLSCGEIRLRVQFHRDGREIEGEESAPVLLIGDDGGDGPISQAVETAGPPLPSPGRGSSRASGSERDAGERADGGRRGPLSPQRRGPATAPASASLKHPDPGASSDLGSAPAFVPRN